MPPVRRTSSCEPYERDTESPEPKRKQGGRHRIFSNEQRKDRNRIAQAAFRERRSQYTKTLESTMANLETIICELQDSNRATSKQLDDAKAESDKLRQLLLAVITDNHSLRRKLKGMQTNQKEESISLGKYYSTLTCYQFAQLFLINACFLLSVTVPTELPCSPVLSMSEDSSDSQSVSSEGSSVADSSFLQFLMGWPSPNDVQGECLFVWFVLIRIQRYI
jgi:hypothetical protein